MLKYNANHSGYKKTNIGLIPEHWDFVIVSSLCSYISKGTTPNKSEMYNPSDIPFLRVNNLTFDGILDFHDLKYINRDTHIGFLGRSQVYPEDILINIVGPPLGKVCFVPHTFDEYNINQAIAFFRPNKNVISRYLFYWLSHEKTFNWFISGSKQTSGQVNLTLELCRNTPIPLPPLTEQKKIADILSTWDNAIEKTEKLIDAKTKLKKGLMHRFLTGQKRFKEFTGKDKWSYVFIKDIIKEVNRPIDWDENTLYNLISVRRRSGGLFFRESLYGRQIKTKNLKIVRTGDFLISKMQVVHGAMGLTTEQFDNMYISDSYISLVPCDENKLNMEFFNWFSKMKHMYYIALVSSTGVHIEKMTFDLEDFLHHKIFIPENIKEQQRIASVLSTIDKEILTLNKKLNALKQQKKGLMQKLLTGEVRVKV